MEYDGSMKVLLWDVAKNEKLRQERGISFEEVAARIEAGAILDVLEHPAPRQHPGQRIYVVEIQGYAYLIPYVEADDHQFLKTIIPSRKATKRYLGKEEGHED
jgi:uncharacterized DUF497 family protein